MVKKSVFLIIMNCLLCILLASVGIFALTTTNFNIAGDILYTFQTKVAYIEKTTLKNYTKTSTNSLTSSQLDEYAKLAVLNFDQITTISFQDASLAGQSSATIEIDMVGLWPTDYVIPTIAHSEINGLEISNSETFLKVNTAELVETGEKKVFTITIENTTESLIDLSLLSIDLIFNPGVSLLEKEYQSDGTTIDYYYLNLGSDSEGNELRWRYFSSIDGNNNIVKAPTSLMGYFIIETCVENKVAFLSTTKYNSNKKHTESGLTNINANDYATSDVRSYLKGDYLTDHNISESDFVYTMITSRSLQDLYTNIIYEGLGYIQDETTGEYVEHEYVFSIDSTDTNYALSLTSGYDMTDDKLWLLSDWEIDKLLDSQDTWPYLPSDFDDGVGYWTRTPMREDPGYTDNSTVSMSGGGWLPYGSAGLESVARAGFIIGY